MRRTESDEAGYCVQRLLWILTDIHDERLVRGWLYSNLSDPVAGTVGGLPRRVTNAVRR